MAMVKFEVGKTYCPHRHSCDKRGVYTITVTKRTKTLVHLKVRISEPEGSPVKEILCKGKLVRYAGAEAECVRFKYDNCPFGCETCDASDTPEKGYHDLLACFRKYHTDANDEDRTTVALRIAKKWYEYEPANLDDGRRSLS